MLRPEPSSSDWKDRIMPQSKLRPTREQTLSAARLIAGHFEPTPLKPEPAFSDLVGARVFVKYEFLNPLRSFKVRGALNLLHHLAESSTISRVITASTGNHGAAMAFACQQYGLPLTVGVPVDADQSKMALVRQYGAELEFVGRDIDETKEIIQQRGLPAGAVFIEDGSCPEIVAGTSTIGEEIVRELPQVETVVVPVGNGALINGIGAALKEHDPAIQVIGVQVDQAPCMTLSFRAGRPVDTETCDTFASGMAVRVSIPEAVELMLEVVDRMVLVSEDDLKQAMGHYLRHTGHLPEGAGAASLAAAQHLRPDLENRTVCLIASGANVDPGLRQEIEAQFTP